MIKGLYNTRLHRAPAINWHEESFRSFASKVPTLLGEDYIKYLKKMESEKQIPLSKERFIFESFSNDYPNYWRRFNYDLVNQLASRSPEVAHWLRRTNDIGLIISDQPDYMRDYVSPEDFERVKKSIELFKVTLNERAKEAQQLADEHRTKVIELQKKFNKKLSEHRNDDLVFIGSMNSSHLPLDKQVEIVESLLEKDEPTRLKLQEAIKDDVRNMKIDALRKGKDGKFKRSDYPLDEIAFEL